MNVFPFVCFAHANAKVNEQNVFKYSYLLMTHGFA